MSAGYWETRLVQALTGVDDVAVDDDPVVWQTGAEGAVTVGEGLEQALQDVLDDEALGENTRQAMAASVASMKQALNYRSGRLAIGQGAATAAAGALSTARTQFAAVSSVPPAPTPETPLPLATPEERTSIEQSNQQAASQHAAQVAAREEQCRQIYQSLQTELDAAADEYAKINAQSPAGPGNEGGGNGPVGPGINRPTRPGGRDHGEVDLVVWEPRDPDRPDDPDRDPDDVRPTPVDPEWPTTPVQPVGPGTFTPGAPGENGLLEARPGVPPALGGGASPGVVGAGGGGGLAGSAVAGGVAAGAGLSAAMRGGGLLGSSGSAAGSSRPFVAGGGQAAGGARGGGATAGRGMAGAGANGRGGAGARGSAGGRGGRGAGGPGGAGGRGATGGGATAGRGTGGRRRDRDEDDPRSFLGREDEWLDDDHTGPAVID
ncbi:MAG: hypothetical protein PIR53_09220 [Nocardioides alkalitolerans]